MSSRWASMSKVKLKIHTTACSDPDTASEGTWDLVFEATKSFLDSRTRILCFDTVECLHIGFGSAFNKEGHTDPPTHPPTHPHTHTHN